MTALAALFGALLVGSAPAQDEWADVDCRSPGSTIEQNVCAGREVETLERELRRYTDAAYAVLRDDEDGEPEALIAEITESERLWKAYADSACGAVYTHWMSGSIRNVMAASCRMKLIKERTHYIWREYLVSMEGTAQLPEPPRSEYKFTVPASQ